MKQVMIAWNFSNAASTYDNSVNVQKRLAEQLIAGISLNNQKNSILDIGCGTGGVLDVIYKNAPALLEISKDS